MKRLLLFMILAALSASLSAATGLRVDKIFNGGYESDSEVELMIMSGDNSFLKKNGVTFMQLFKGPSAKYASKIVPLLKADGSKAIGQKVTYDKGRLHYAFYSLPPKTVGKVKLNRYICYLDGPKNQLRNVMLLYIEGPISPDKANRLFKSM